MTIGISAYNELEIAPVKFTLPEDMQTWPTRKRKLYSLQSQLFGINLLDA
jgi:hypothetical protein